MPTMRTATPRSFDTAVDGHSLLSRANQSAILHAIANGQDWTTAEIPGGNVMALCHDIRTYYEEAALELIDGPAPGGRAMENWFFETTEAGATVLGARTAMKDAGAKFPIWFFMAPGNR